MVYVGPPQGKKSPPQERGSRGQRPLVSTLWSHNTQGTGCEVLSFHCGRMLSRVLLLSARRSTLHCLCGIPRCAAHLLRAFTVRQLGHVCVG